MKKQFAVAMLLATAPFAASAGKLSYNFVEAGYVRTDIDDLGDGDGFGINGSVAINDMFHVFGGFTKQQGDDEELGVDVDLDQFRIGVGYRHAASDRTDVLARAAYERVETDVDVVDFGRLDAQADGYSLEAGLRSQLTERLELSAMVGYTDTGTVKVEGVTFDTDEGEDGAFYGRLGAQLKFNPMWGLVGEGRFSEDAQQLFLGVRASF